MIHDFHKLPIFSTPEQEQTFWISHDARRIGVRRFFMWVGLAIFLSFSGLDFLVGGDATTHLLSLRVVVAMAMIGSYALFCQAENAIERERAIVFYGLSAILGEIGFCLIAPVSATAFYQFGLAVVIGFGAVIIVPRFSTVRLLFTSMAAVYIIAMPFFPSDLFPTLINASFVLLVAVSVVIGSFEREKIERRQAMTESDLAQANTALASSRKEALKSRDEAVRANQAKNHFVASMSHELRTPMNAIIGFSDVIRNELFGPIGSEEYREYIGYVHSSGRLLQANIDDLLDMSRIEAGKLGWADENFSLFSTLKNAIATCQADAEAAGIAIVAPESGERIELYSDLARTSQAVINLLTNALKFTEKGGTVTVSSDRDAKGNVVIAVADTGCGMSPDVLDRIRKPFEQAHTDSSSKGKGGLGLGLAIVGGIMGKMGGRLDLASEEGVGTTASLIIPNARVIDNNAQAA